MLMIISVLAVFLSALPTSLFAAPPEVDKKLANEVKSSDPIVRSEAVLKIRKTLEESETNEAVQKDMVDQLIAGDVITALVKCLTKKEVEYYDEDDDDDDDDDDVGYDDDYATKENAARVLVIIAERRPNEAALVDTKKPFMRWLTRPMEESLLFKYGATLRVQFANCEIKSTRKRSVMAINSELKERQWPEEMLDKFVAAGVIMPLLKCLTNDEDDNTTKHDAAWVLESIARYRPKEPGLANAELVLMQWLTIPMEDDSDPMEHGVLWEAATEYFITKAESNEEAGRLQAVSVIHKGLEECLTNGTTKKLIDKIISFYGFTPLYACFEGNSPQPSLVPSARALEIIAEQSPKQMEYSSNFINNLLKWLKRSEELDDEVIKQMASILRNLSAHIPSEDRKDKLDRIWPLIESSNPHIVEQVEFAAFNLIRNMDEIPELIKVEQIQTMVRFVVDVNFFYGYIVKGKSSDKLTAKILSALELLLLNPTPNDGLIVEQIEQNRSEIGQFNTGSGTIAARILSLLENRIEIERSSIVSTTTAAPQTNDISDTNTKKILKDTVMLQLLYRNQLKSFSTSPITILLFGEPGTGKATLAKAVANEAGAKLFSLTASSIIAKEENDAIAFIKVLFHMAKNAQPFAVIFIDEIDELLGRGMDIDAPLRYLTKQRVRTEFLVQMGNCCSSSSPSSSSANDRRVLVIGATIQPWEMDNNTLRHFAKRIYVEMPDQAARAQMLQKIVEENQKDFQISAKEIKKLAAMTENFSFDHLRELCQEANIDALRSDGAKDGLHSLQHVAITMKNFENAHHNIKPFSSEEDAKKMKQFAENTHFSKRQKVHKK